MITMLGGGERVLRGRIVASFPLATPSAMAPSGASPRDRLRSAHPGGPGPTAVGQFPPVRPNQTPSIARVPPTSQPNGNFDASGLRPLSAASCIRAHRRPGPTCAPHQCTATVLAAAIDPGVISFSHPWVHQPLLQQAYSLPQPGPIAPIFRGPNTFAGAGPGAGSITSKLTSGLRW
jgi:hypothetical protein